MEFGKKPFNRIEVKKAGYVRLKRKELAEMATGLMTGVP